VGQAALRVAAFGGGTGLPVLLSGLRDLVGGRLTAVVTVADDGGSSGRLRQELGIAPPGDVRRCLVALAERRRLADVFEYRFESGVELRDHSVGNIIIAALADMSGGFSEGVERAGRFLRIKGAVLPAATESLTLVVHYTDGSVTRGESTLPEHSGRIARIAVEPAGALAPPGVIAAIEQADVVVLSPGSLYTSTIPALLGGGIADSLAAFGGPVVYAANLMTQPGETLGFSVSDHLRAIRAHVGPVVTDVLVNSVALPVPVAARYRDDGAAPVALDRDEVDRMGVRIHSAPLLDETVTSTARHDPDRLAATLLALTPAATTSS
jgi:uncharacterized cofD-like protein